jgi:hypothetical protein
MRRHLFHSSRSGVAWCSCDGWRLWGAEKESAIRSFVMHRANALGAERDRQGKQNRAASALYRPTQQIVLQAA